MNVRHYNVAQKNPKIFLHIRWQISGRKIVNYGMWKFLKIPEKACMYMHVQELKKLAV